MQKHKRYSVIAAPGDLNPHFVVIDGERDESENLVSAALPHNEAMAMADYLETTHESLMRLNHIETFLERTSAPRPLLNMLELVRGVLAERQSIALPGTPWTQPELATDNIDWKTIAQSRALQVALLESQLDEAKTAAAKWALKAGHAIGTAALLAKPEKPSAAELERIIETFALEAASDPALPADGPERLTAFDYYKRGWLAPKR